MIDNRKVGRIASLFLLGFLGVSSALAQTAATGALTGTITDPSGAVIPGVKVIVVHTATSNERQTTTDSAGVYRIPLLLPGVYSAEFSAAGFKTQSRPNIVINVTETHALNVAMEVGAVNESVTVAEGAELVQPESSTLGRVVGNLTVRTLPLTTRNYTQILHLSPGVVADLTNAGELGRNTQDVFANGMRAIDNNFQMDGSHVNNFGTGRAGDWLGYTGISIPNPDAIQEFKVQTTLYDAGYGRGVGANVNVVTRSGGNDFHGTLFEFFRNEVLNANDFFINRVGRSKPVLKQNQFGGTFGGPIRRDRLFFFGSYQGTRQVNGVGSSSLRSVFLPPLTDDRSAATLGRQFCGQAGANGGVAVACNGANINPVALKLLNFKLPNGQYIIPTPQVIQPNGLGFSVFSIPASFSEDQVIANIDYLLTKKHTLVGRWFSSRDPQVASFTSSNTVGSGAQSNFQNRNATLKLVSVLTPTFVNEGKFTFLRNYGNLDTQTPVKVTDIGMTPSSDQPVIPTISVTNLFHLGGNWNDNFKTAVTSFQMGDQISWLHGRHSIRAGFEVEKIGDNFDLKGVKRGGLTFLGFPDFLLGMSAAQNGSAFSNIFSSSGFGGFSDKQFRLKDWFSFIQDDWKIHPQLTLNLGLRWEIQGGVAEKRGRMVNFWPLLASNDFPSGGTLTGFVAATNFPDQRPAGVGTTGNRSCCVNSLPLHNWGPRIGLAWRPFQGNQHLAVRAGFGIFYSRTSGNDVLQLNQQAPYIIGVRNDGVLNALATFQVPFNPGPPSAYPVWLPRTRSTQLTVENLAQNWDSPFAEQYSLNVQYEFRPNWLLELGYVGSRATRILRFRQVNQAQLASPEHPINGITTNTVANARDRVWVLGMAPNGLFQLETYGFAMHNSLQTSVTKRFSQGFQFQTSYTFGKTLDDVPNGQGLNSVWGGFFSNDVYNRHQAWGPADFDRRHRLVGNYLWELPLLPKATGFLGVLAHGWQISGVTTFQTGKPLTISDNRGGSIFGGTAFRSRAELCPGITHGSIPTSGSVNSRIDGYVDYNAFCPPVAIGNGRGFGTLGRGVIHGPDQRNFDMAISKRIPMKGKEGSNIEFRAEFFNLFNTTQFDDPALTIPSGNFDKLTPAIVGNFGKVQAAKVAPRLVQFALKYNF